MNWLVDLSLLAECSSGRILNCDFPVFTDPESITGINATYISDTEITLTWDLPEGEYNAFEVKKEHLLCRIIFTLTFLPSRLE